MNNTKKILFYTDTPIVGGAEEQILLLARYFNLAIATKSSSEITKKQFEIHLACGINPSLDSWCEKLRRESVIIHRIETTNKHNPKHYFKLREIIQKQKIDLLHAHIWNPASCRYAFLVSAKTKVPFFITEHDPFPLPFLKNLIKKFLLWLTKEQLLRVICVSQENAKFLKKLYPSLKNKISTIYNGIDLNTWKAQTLRFTENDDEKLQRDIFHCDPKDRIIITVAQLHKRKGLKYLIATMPELTGEFPDLKLIIVGEGPERQSLEKEIKRLELIDTVRLLGKQKNIPQLLRSADIFVLPSVREAFGLALIEAMAIPLPVISSNTGGIPEIITAESGILVPPGDTMALTKAIRFLLLNPKKAKEMKEKAQKRINEKFDFKIMGKQYEKYYKITFY